MKLNFVLVRSPFNLIWLLAAMTWILPLGAIAHTPSSQKAETFVYNPPPPPSGQGAPVGRQQGGASRGSCRDYAGLTALVPESDGLVQGWTSVAEPTFWFYVPAALKPDTKIEWVVQDQNDEYVTRQKLALQTDSAGIVPIQLERPSAPLEVGQTYQWTLSIDCDPTRKAASVYVQGLLGRTGAPAFQTEPSSEFERATQYAAQGVWFESLTLLAKLRQTEPNNLDIAQAWYDLLQQVELGSVAPAKLLNTEELSLTSGL